MPAGDWWILLDLDRQYLLGTGWESMEEHSVILAASLSARGLKEEHPVGLAVNGSEASWTVPRRNEYQQRALLKSLAVASPSPMGLQDYLQRVGPSLASRCCLLIITSNVDAHWTESLLPLMWRGIQPTVFLLDPVTFGGTAEPRPATDLLRMMSVPCHIIPREMLDKQQVQPGHEGEWEWRISGTGKAIAVKTPTADWRRLE
jgi:uncharacterized protein (DUF58 family)